MSDSRLFPNEAPFVRLWRGFLTGRLMIAVALLVLQLLGYAFNQAQAFTPAVLAVCVAYLVATVMLRILGRHAPPYPGTGPHWLPSIGVDILAVSALQLLHPGTMNYTPLFGLPILMAAVLGTLTLALGTTAAVTLLLLLWAWWTGDQSSSDDAQRYLQSALTGTGYFVVTYLVHQLSARLVGEQEVAERSRMKAQVQTQISSVNGTAQQIASLNDQISKAEASTGQPANDLRDQRAALKSAATPAAPVAAKGKTSAKPAAPAKKPAKKLAKTAKK